MSSGQGQFVLENGQCVACRKANDNMWANHLAHFTHFSFSSDEDPLSGNMIDTASKMTSLGKLLWVEEAELVLAAETNEHGNSLVTELMWMKKKKTSFCSVRWKFRILLSAFSIPSRSASGYCECKLFTTSTKISSSIKPAKEVYPDSKHMCAIEGFQSKSSATSSTRSHLLLCILCHELDVAIRNIWKLPHHRELRNTESDGVALERTRTSLNLSFCLRENPRIPWSETLWMFRPDRESHLPCKGCCAAPFHPPPVMYPDTPLWFQFTERTENTDTSFRLQEFHR